MRSLNKPGKTITQTIVQIESRRITKAERERLKRVAALPDDQIDTSDIPEAKGPAGWVRVHQHPEHRLHRVLSRLLSIRLPEPDIALAQHSPNPKDCPIRPISRRCCTMRWNVSVNWRRDHQGPGDHAVEDNRTGADNRCGVAAAACLRRRIFRLLGPSIRGMNKSSVRADGRLQYKERRRKHETDVRGGIVVCCGRLCCAVRGHRHNNRQRARSLIRSARSERSMDSYLTLRIR